MKLLIQLMWFTYNVCQQPFYKDHSWFYMVFHCSSAPFYGTAFHTCLLGKEYDYIQKSVCVPLTILYLVAGFKCWDTEATGIDINEELAQIANRASLGEEGPNGELSPHDRTTAWRVFVIGYAVFVSTSKMNDLQVDLKLIFWKSGISLSIYWGW